MSLELDGVFRQLFEMLRQTFSGWGFSALGSRLAVMGLQTAAIGVFVFSMPAVLVYAERKISAWMQRRMGPSEVGPFGLLQTLADTVKLFFKADVRPRGADAFAHQLAPAMTVFPVFACFAPIPFGKGLTLINLDAGVLWVFALSGISVVGILIGGWGSASKFSLIGGVRGAAQVVSYEIPRLLSVVPILMVYGTQSLTAIAEAQTGRWHGLVPQWFIFYPHPLFPVIGVLTFLIFLICSVAETNRTPFDLPEAESELVAGFHTEFSGFKFAFFFLAEYAYVVLASMMAVALFFGGGDGYHAGGLLPSWAWFFAKTAVLIFCFFWFRWTFPRLRVDRLMQLCWRFLLPWSVVLIVATGIWTLRSSR